MYTPLRPLPKWLALQFLLWHVPVCLTWLLNFTSFQFQMCRSIFYLFWMNFTSCSFKCAGQIVFWACVFKVSHRQRIVHPKTIRCGYGNGITILQAKWPALYICWTRCSHADKTRMHAVQIQQKKTKQNNLKMFKQSISRRPTSQMTRWATTNRTNEKLQLFGPGPTGVLDHPRRGGRVTDSLGRIAIIDGSNQGNTS